MGIISSEIKIIRNKGITNFNNVPWLYECNFFNELLSFL